jgi:hypothetical protein
MTPDYLPYVLSSIDLPYTLYSINVLSSVDLPYTLYSINVLYSIDLPYALYSIDLTYILYSRSLAQLDAGERQWICGKSVHICTIAVVHGHCFGKQSCITAVLL